MAYLIYRGKRMCQCMIDAIKAVEKEIGTTITITQGGYNAGGVAASAGTHDKGGVWDQPTLSRSATAKCRAIGVWPNTRTRAQGFSSNHSHTLVFGCPHMAPGLKYQERELRATRNGLAGRGRDTDPRPSKIITFAQWQAAQHAAANAKADGKTLLINGKYYTPITTVGVKWVERSRTAGSFSRHTYYVQAWLKKLGYYVSTLDGKWGKVTQAAYDNFRSKKLGLKGADAKGSVGKASLTKLASLAGSKMTVTDK